MLGRAGGEAAGDGLEEPLATAVAHWKAWFGRRDEVAGRLLPHVARWEWTLGPRHSELPYHFQRFPGRSRVLKQAPLSKSQHHECGLDADGRLLVERVYDYREQASEAYVLYGDALTEIVEFGPKPHIPIRNERIVIDEGHVVRHESFRLNGYTPKYAEKAHSPDGLIAWLGPLGRFLHVEDYRYDGPLLAAIDGYGEVPGLGPHRYTERFSHDADGSLTGIDRQWADGTVQVVYRPRRKGQGTDELRRTAVTQLVGAVAETVRAAAPDGPVYCLELSYQEIAQYFPPLITLGFERDRSVIREADLVFRPMLSGGRTLELPNPDSLAACRQLDQEGRGGGDWRLGERMLREAAVALTRHDWSGIMDVTADFVAFALDPEMTELEDALQASAPAESIADWKSRGWL